jgi:hypothetical protein
MSDPTARRPDFDAQNLFFLAVLGLLSGSSRVRGLLERHGRPIGGAPAVAPAAVDGDPVLALVLGVVALRERLLGHVSAGLTMPTAGADEPADERPLAGLRALLR